MLAYVHHSYLPLHAELYSNIEDVCGYIIYCKLVENKHKEKWSWDVKLFLMLINPHTADYAQ